MNKPKKRRQTGSEGEKWLELILNENFLNPTGREELVKEMIEPHLEDIPHLLRNFYHYTLEFGFQTEI